MKCHLDEMMICHLEEMVIDETSQTHQNYPQYVNWACLELVMRNIFTPVLSL